MSGLTIIFRREYLERVRSRSFIVSTIITPLFVGGVMIGPMLANRDGPERSYRFFLVDESARMAAPLVEAVNERQSLPAAPGGNQNGGGAALSLETTPSGGGVRAVLDEQTTSGTIAGYLWLPADVLAGGRAELRIGEDVPGAVAERLETILTGAAQAERVREAGLTTEQIASLFQPVEVELQRLEEGGGDREEGAGTGLAFMLGFILYFLILMNGAQVMQSVQREKTSRIAEVLVSSVRPAELMLGKVLAVGAIALTQVAVWAAFARLVFGPGNRLARFGVPPNALESLIEGVGVFTLASTVGFLVLGFLLYATLFAAAGAAAGSSEDAQRFVLPLTIPLIAPILMFSVIADDPNGVVAVAMSWLPLTSPLVVPMRMGVGGASTIEVIVALAVLVASVAATAWVAGKIYRIGILSAGTRPSLGELARWVRMA